MAGKPTDDLEAWAILNETDGSRSFESVHLAYGHAYAALTALAEETIRSFPGADPLGTQPENLATLRDGYEIHLSLVRLALKDEPFSGQDPATYGEAAAVPDPESDSGPYRASAKVEPVAGGWAVVLLVPFTGMGDDGRAGAETACADFMAHRKEA